MEAYCVKCRKKTSKSRLKKQKIKQKMVDQLYHQNALTVELKSQDL